MSDISSSNSSSSSSLSSKLKEIAENTNFDVNYIYHTNNCIILGVRKIIFNTFRFWFYSNETYTNYKYDYLIKIHVINNKKNKIKLNHGMNTIDIHSIPSETINNSIEYQELLFKNKKFKDKICIGIKEYSFNNETVKNILEKANIKKGIHHLFQRVNRTLKRFITGVDKNEYIAILMKFENKNDHYVNSNIILDNVVNDEERFKEEKHRILKTYIYLVYSMLMQGYFIKGEIDFRDIWLKKDSTNKNPKVKNPIVENQMVENQIVENQKGEDAGMYDGVIINMTNCVDILGKRKYVFEKTATEYIHNKNRNVVFNYIKAIHDFCNAAKKEILKKESHNKSKSSKIPVIPLGGGGGKYVGFEIISNAVCNFYNEIELDVNLMEKYNREIDAYATKNGRNIDKYSEYLNSIANKSDELRSQYSDMSRTSRTSKKSSQSKTSRTSRKNIQSSVEGTSSHKDNNIVDISEIYFENEPLTSGENPTKTNKVSYISNYLPSRKEIHDSKRSSALNLVEASKRNKKPVNNSNVNEKPFNEFYGIANNGGKNKSRKNITRRK